MNILKSIMGYTPAPLARLSDKETIQTMSGLMAYVCLQCPTKTISESAPRGRCEKCGSSSILPVSSCLETTLQWRWQCRKARGEESRESGTPRSAVYKLTAKTLEEK